MIFFILSINFTYNSNYPKRIKGETLQNTICSKQEKYNGDFLNDLIKSNDLVNEVVEFFYTYYPDDKYYIEKNFDVNYTILFEDLNNEEQEEIIQIYSKCYQDKSKEEIINILKYQSIRGFDIAIMNIEKTIIYEGIECKDFCQMLKHDVTGVPSFYYEKIDFIKKYFEKKQGTEIKLSFFFKDNNKLKELKKDINFDFTINNENFLPYGNDVKEMKLNESLSNNPYFCSYFYNKKFEQNLFQLSSLKKINEIFDERFKDFLSNKSNKLEDLDVFFTINKIENLDVFFTTNNFKKINIKNVKSDFFVVGNLNSINIYEKNVFCNYIADVYLEQNSFKLIKTINL